MMSKSDITTLAAEDKTTITTLDKGGASPPVEK